MKNCPLEVVPQIPTRPTWRTRLATGRIAESACGFRQSRSGPSRLAALMIVVPTVDPRLNSHCRDPSSVLMANDLSLGQLMLIGVTFVSATSLPQYRVQDCD